MFLAFLLNYRVQKATKSGQVTERKGMVVHATHESPLKGNFGEVGIDGLT